MIAELRLQGEACNVVTLCRLREECLRAAGFCDLFASVKAVETDRALALLPSVLRSVDSAPTPSAACTAACSG